MRGATGSIERSARQARDAQSVDASSLGKGRSPANRSQKDNANTLHKLSSARLLRKKRGSLRHDCASQYSADYFVLAFLQLPYPRLFLLLQLLSTLTSYSEARG